MENMKWIFSGIGVLILSLIIGYLKYLLSKKNKTLTKDNAKQPQKIVNQYGDKSAYIENNNGNITIN